jgi:hypothetical protein
MAYFQVQVILRPRVSWLVSPGVRPPSETSYQFLFLSAEIIFTYFFLYRVPSLTRGQLCNLFVQAVLCLTSAVIFGSKSRRTVSCETGFHFNRLLRLGMSYLLLVLISGDGD